jgi:hypothetical protein
VLRCRVRVQSRTEKSREKEEGPTEGEPLLILDGW